MIFDYRGPREGSSIKEIVYDFFLISHSAKNNATFTPEKERRCRRAPSARANERPLDLLDANEKGQQKYWEDQWRRLVEDSALKFIAVGRSAIAYRTEFEVRAGTSIFLRRVSRSTKLANRIRNASINFESLYFSNLSFTRLRFTTCTCRDAFLLERIYRYATLKESRESIRVLFTRETFTRLEIFVYFKVSFLLGRS